MYIKRSDFWSIFGHSPENVAPSSHICEIFFGTKINKSKICFVPEWISKIL
jgi:hypothetical protein